MSALPACGPKATMAMAAVTRTTAAVSNRLHCDQDRDGLVAQSTMTGAISSVPPASASQRAIHLATGFARPRSLARTRPNVAMVALIIAVGAKAMRANFATPTGVVKVSRPYDQRSISQAPANAATGVPSAMQVASERPPPPTAVEKNAPSKIAGQIR